MVYERIVWKNKEVERPRTFEKIENPDGTITLVPAEGNIIEPGTPIIAENMNKIEQGIEDAHSAIGNLEDDFESHKNERAIHKTSDIIRTETNTQLKVEVVSSSVSETPDAGRIIFDTSQDKFFGGNGTEWV